MGSTNENFELFNGQTDEQSVFTPESWINKNQSASEQPPLPENWIFSYWPALRGVIKRLYRTKDNTGFKPPFPAHTLIYKKHRICVTFPGIGAPLAAMRLEEAEALGARRIVFIGFCGYLAPDIRQGNFILPIRAIRDEGTSFHYARPGRYSSTDAHLSGALKSELDERQILFREGTVWTTDAPYREIPSKIARMRQEGVLCVDMEASALFSAGSFKRIAVAGLLIARDPVSYGSALPPPSGSGRIVNPAPILETVFSALIRSV